MTKDRPALIFEPVTLIIEREKQMRIQLGLESLFVSKNVKENCDHLGPVCIDSEGQSYCSRCLEPLN